MLKAEIILAIIHGTGGDRRQHAARKRWGSLLDRIATRNLVQVRLDPDLSSTLGLGAFDRAFAGANLDRIVTDETLWLPQAPDLFVRGLR